MAGPASPALAACSTDCRTAKEACGTGGYQAVAKPAWLMSVLEDEMARLCMSSRQQLLVAAAAGAAAAGDMPALHRLTEQGLVR